MLKNSFKDPFITNECKDYYFSCFPIYMVSMSSDKLPPIDDCEHQLDELDLITIDLDEIIRNPFSTQGTSEEDREQIRHLE